MAAVTSVQYFTERFSLTCKKPVSHLQLACCPSHCAVPWQDKNIRIYENSNLEPPLELTGHHGDVSAMAFGTVTDRLLLCSASEDYVIVWDIDRCYTQIKEGNNACRVVGTLLGRVVHLSLCPLSAKMAACSGSRVFILNAEREEAPRVLKAHLGPVTASEFCPWDVNLLVSASEDRTFKIWDMKKGDILFESAVLSAYPLLSLFFMEQNSQFITGSGDGQLWCYTLPVDHKCRLVTKLDLSKLEQKHERNLRKNISPQIRPDGATRNDVRGTVETAKPVLRIWAQKLHSSHTSLKQRGSCVWIGSSDGLYLLDLDTSELLMNLPLRGDLSISMAGSWAISNELGGNMCCLVTSLFGTSVALLEVNSARLDELCFRMATGLSVDEQLSAVPSSPLMTMSPLNAELAKHGPKPQRKIGWSLQNHTCTLFVAKEKNHLWIN
uniref:WD repeat domain 27 n=1 Tax=Cyprinus carpio TaxID=7962 RepID=A0A8C2KJ81_CYPCA